MSPRIVKDFCDLLQSIYDEALVGKDDALNELINLTGQDKQDYLDHVARCSKCQAIIDKIANEMSGLLWWL